MNALTRLANAVETAFVEQPFVDIAGVVKEVAPTHYRAAGLSAVTRQS